MKRKCFLISEDIPCFVHLGKFGDEMVIMPALRELYLRTGRKPVVIAASPYHTIYDGVTYADAIGVQWGDHRDGIAKARQFAWYMFGNAIVPKWWDDLDAFFPDVRDSQHRLVLSYRGRVYTLDQREHPCYMSDQWRATGFEESEMLSLPLVFDRRNQKRESELVRTYVRGNKPLFLINFEGQSSPFSFVPEVMNAIRPLLKEFQVLSLDDLRATRIYDLLGLYDIAAGMITTDTATLHLAAASNIPYIAFTRHDWGHSYPRGNCILEIYYPDTLRRLNEMCAAIQHFSNAHTRLDTIRSQEPGDTPEKRHRPTNLAVPVLA